MNYQLIGCIALGLVVTETGATAQEAVGACRAQSSETAAMIVCGQNGRALTVVSGTQSPDDRLAVAWRDGQANSDRDWVESFLVRLSDGMLVQRLVSKFEGSKGQLYSHEDVTVYWNLESTVFAIIVSQKWETRSLEVYMRSYDGKIIRLGDFSSKIEAFIWRHVHQQRPELSRNGYTMSLRPGPVVRRGDVIHLEAILQVPKSDEAPNLEFRIKLDVSDDGVQLGGPYR